jgi:hypothetical protein
MHNSLLSTFLRVHISTLLGSFSGRLIIIHRTLLHWFRTKRVHIGDWIIIMCCAFSWCFTCLCNSMHGLTAYQIHSTRFWVSLLSKLYKYSNRVSLLFRTLYNLIDIPEFLETYFKYNCYLKRRYEVREHDLYPGVTRCFHIVWGWPRRQKPSFCGDTCRM